MLRKIARRLSGRIEGTLRALRRPRVIATFLVRDEHDIIGLNIEHTLAAGVDHAIVTDNGSVDGTTDLLRQYERAGAITLIHQPEHTYNQGAWVTKMARLSASEFRATWVINLDADEFVWPQDGAHPICNPFIKSALAHVPLGHGFVNLRREDMRPNPHASSADWVVLNTLRDLGTRSWRSGKPLGPKAAHRADPEVVVQDGNHFASGPRIAPNGEWSDHLVLLHFPDRGYAHYERKIANGGAAILARGAGIGTHWQEDYARLQNGTLRAAYDARQVNAAEIPQLLASGRIVEERAFAARIREIKSRSIVL